MTSEEKRKLCLALIHVDAEEKVIQLLKEHELWDDCNLWRFYGDNESNYSTIGNQGRRAEAALVEKLVNSVDARLMGECLSRGIDPESAQAPNAIREAVAKFFYPASNSLSSTAGLLVDWPKSKRLKVAHGNTLAITGYPPSEGKPTVTISDSGEGQTPDKFPHTILSLHKQNKLKIPFVQGKFNQGGTGALNFCGKNRLQLVVSRRNPKLLNGSVCKNDSHWGFTVVRREQRPGFRTSVFTYLAPATGQAVLSFPGGSLPLFPEGKNPYARQAEWGTLIKLYEYQLRSRGHILRKDGLLYRLDLLLPQVALPIRLHECRSGYRGHEGSFATNLTGFRTRLEDDRINNLEFAPSSSPIKISGEPMEATIYVFKRGKADTYRKNEGIVFTVNGQTHGHLTTDFFRRKKVGLSYLRDSVLVVLNCSRISQANRDDLFMTNREQIRDNEFSREIKKVLEDLLHRNQALKDLRERRRRKEIEGKVSDDRPLEDILRDLLKNSPALSSLFLEGNRLTNPFKPRQGRKKKVDFKGKRFPTIFKFRKRKVGAKLERDCHINMRARIAFETDADNEYFSRDVDPGTFNLYQISDESRASVQDYVLNLQSGVATLSVRLPANSQEGDNLRFQAEVSDLSRLKAFRNIFQLNVKAPAKPPPRSKKRRKMLPTGINLPTIKEIPEEDWEKQNPQPFTKTTGLRIKHAGFEGEGGDNNSEGEHIYDFYINRDNIHLKNFLKAGKTIGEGESKLVRAQFRYGLVLLGLALIKCNAEEAKNSSEASQSDSDDDEETNIEDRVERFSSAAAAVLLPLIRSLGELDVSEE